MFQGGKEACDLLVCRGPRWPPAVSPANAGRATRRATVRATAGAFHRPHGRQLESHGGAASRVGCRGRLFLLPGGAASVAGDGAGFGRVQLAGRGGGVVPGTAGSGGGQRAGGGPAPAGL